MPPKKRAMSETNANVQPPAKRASTGSKEDKTKDRENEKQGRKIADLPADHISNRPPYEYITMDKAYWFGSDSDSDSDDEDEETSKQDTEMFNKPASSHPDWKYTIMPSTWRRLTDQITKAKYTNPDLFDMYIYNDFHGYGLVELLENLLVDFNKAFKGKDLNEMWGVTATMGHWLNHDDGSGWLNIDDGERTERLFGGVGCMLLTSLEMMMRDGELKAESKFRDLGLVMALYFKCAIFPAEIPLEEGLEWREELIGYAKAAGIELDKVGVDGVEEALGEFEEVEARKAGKKADLWGWAKKFKDLGGSRLGGDKFNILLMSRKKRAQYAFDKTDPLKDFTDKQLRGEDGWLDIC